MKNKVQMIILGGLLGSVFAACKTLDSGASHNRNILLIMVDDLRPELGCMGNERILTPNMDQLAKDGVLFKNAYCQVPVCGASRASMLTGLYPTQERFWHWDCKADVDAPGAITMNSFFKENGYLTIANGKIFHHQEDSKSGWSEDVYYPEGVYHKFDYLNSDNFSTIPSEQKGPAFEWNGSDNEKYRDELILDKSIKDLKNLAKQSKPFFLAVGFHKPHLPFNAPRKYWDLYDDDRILLPANPFPPLDAPARAIHNFGELRQYSNIPDTEGNSALDVDLSKKLIKGYYACTSFIDAEIGVLLTELEKNGLDDNTIIVLVGDHGWNLLEHGLWCKHSNFESSLKPAFIIRAPGMKKGVRSTAIVELVDIFPTLCEYAGLNVPKTLEGRSLIPVLNGESLMHKDFAFARWYQGHTIITENYSYTEWWDDQAGAVRERMLFDRRSDNGENYNVAELKMYDRIVEELSGNLRRQFNPD
ncbi:MAG: sulfatase [Bacteroidales bacterium]|nr:sulfatase [Bacteroidales bacterium]